MTLAELARARIERQRLARGQLAAAQLALNPVEDAAEIKAIEAVREMLRKRIFQAGGEP